MIFGACSGISLRQELLTPKALVNAVRSHTVLITAIKFAIIAAVKRQRCIIYSSHKKWDFRKESLLITSPRSIPATLLFAVFTCVSKRPSTKVAVLQITEHEHCE